MRLLHVVPTYFPAVRYGGPIHSVHGLCAALAARGHEVHVFTTNVDGSGDSDVPLGRPTAMDGVKVWYFPSRRLRRLYWSPPMQRMLRKEAGGFDLLHLHSVFLWPTWAAARAARRSGVPYVVSPRGMLVKDLFRARSRLVKTIWMALIERTNLEHAAAIHVTSEVEATEIARFGIRLRGRLFDVPNGVVVQTDAPRPQAPTSPYIMMLGRINWKKRIEIGLEALTRVDGIHLVIAGDDDDGLAAALRARATSLGVAERVEFAGPVEGLRKRQLLHGALALLMPSLSENFGNSALEAMAEGTPVIVVPQVGIADAIKESGSGFVVGPNAEAFADAVRQLQANPDLRSRMGERGRAAVAAGFSWAAIGEQMEIEYGTIVNDFRGST